MMVDKFKQHAGRSPERYPNPEPIGHPEGGGLRSSWFVTVAGAVLALAGAAGAAWGLFILNVAFSPDNRTNPLREIGIAMGAGVALLCGLLCLCGVLTMLISVRRRRTSSRKRGRLRGCPLGRAFRHPGCATGGMRGYRLVPPLASHQRGQRRGMLTLGGPGHGRIRTWRALTLSGSR
jgi:hypothetical protein